MDKILMVFILFFSLCLIFLDASTSLEKTKKDCSKLKGAAYVRCKYL